MKELQEYQVCWYEDDSAFMEGEMRRFRSFSTEREADAYIDRLCAEERSGFVQLLLKSNPNFAADFPIGGYPAHFAALK